MGSAFRFTLALVVGLALLTAIASFAVHSTTRSWFERDIALRAELVVNAARRELLAALGKSEPEGLTALLTDITHDERIMAAALCTPGRDLAGQTSGFPLPRVCDDERFNSSVASEETAVLWTSIEASRGGDIHLTVLPLRDQGTTKAYVVLVHDMSYVERREATTRSFLLIAFAVLAVAASLVTLVAARLSWRNWNKQFRHLLSGFLRGAHDERPEFKPLLRDVREFAARIADRETEGDGRWTTQRLKQTLSKQLEGDQVIILANREPYIHQKKGTAIEILHPASGLVTALEPIMRACSGVWIAHGSGSADREAADKRGRIQVPPGENDYWIRRVWLTKEEELGYYYGFSNEGLWPLCHLAHARPVFRSADWEHYKAVNQKFADAVCDEVSGKDPIILVQDYHFALAPALIRQRLPEATILTFWHIPWPNAERFGICPWREELLSGLLGSSIVGFHTQQHCNNFLDSVDHYLEARVDREHFAVVQQRRRTLVKPYPISIEWPSRWVASANSVAECRASVVAELGLGSDALIGVGVDRLDYTKGVEERLLAVERMLERHPELRGRFSFIQLAAPSRTLIERYQRLNEDVERLAVRINEKFGSGHYQPVILLRSHHEPPSVFRYYRAADVCYVSSLHDGMNLVAKEFVAARDDEQGVLVLSHFTGAARELTEALIVNPYDLEEASAALATAVAMPAAEQRERMRAMRSIVSEFNVYRWAGRMLIDAARLRRHSRLAGRLSGQASEQRPAL